MTPLTCRILLLGLALAAGGGAARAQTAEVEPNHPCTAAQNVPSANGALTLTGRRDSGDVDFFRLSGPPGAMMIVDLEGAGTGAGTLPDGFLGAFSTDCASLLAADDDSGFGLDPRLLVSIPVDGSLVLAVTSFPDFSFTGAGGAAGTYRLRTSVESVTGELSGRMVDAETGQPVRFVDVEVARCFEGSCGFPSQSGFTDEDGRFRIQSDVFFLMTGGLYELTARHFSFEPFSRLIEIHGKTDIDLGDLPLQPIPALSSISGRVVDAATGQPLAGHAPPHALVLLRRCFGSSFCSAVASQFTGADGRFRFEGSIDQPFETGLYEVQLLADQYRSDLGDPFPMGDDEDRELGDLPARSNPVRVEEIAQCGPLPSRGGRCRFTVAVSNGQATPLLARGWVTVAAFFFGPFQAETSYQLPQRLIDLPAGGSTALAFTLDVPGTIPNGTLLCANFFAAAKDRPLEPFAGRDLFCLTKGAAGITRVPDAELRRRLEAAGAPAGR